MEITNTSFWLLFIMLIKGQKTKIIIKMKGGKWRYHPVNFCLCRLLASIQFRLHIVVSKLWRFQRSLLDRWECVRTIWERARDWQDSAWAFAWWTWCSQNVGHTKNTPMIIWLVDFLLVAERERLCMWLLVRIQTEETNILNCCRPQTERLSTHRKFTTEKITLSLNLII